MRRKSILLTVAGLFLATGAEARTLMVCTTGCAFSDIQPAVDAAKDGDRIRIGRGVYTPHAYRDIAYGKLTIRGFVLLDNRRLTLESEPGAVLDGGDGLATSAIVVRGGDVKISGLTVRDFRAVDNRDDIYDGHGVFQIGGHLRLRDMRIESVTKMALVVREDGVADAAKITIANNGVGIWIDEQARLRLSQSVVSGNTYSGLAVYASSQTDLWRVHFSYHTDDAVFIDGQAQVRVKRSAFNNNRPFVFNLNDRGRLTVHESTFCRNEAVSKPGLEVLGSTNRTCKE